MLDFIKQISGIRMFVGLRELRSNGAIRVIVIRNNSVKRIDMAERYRGKFSKESEDKYNVIFFYLPLSVLFWEVVFHVYMGYGIHFLFIVCSFALAFGLFAVAVLYFIPEKINIILTAVFSCVFMLVYDIEIICKNILQQYYQLFSTMDTAMNNHLSDYKSAILQAVLSNIIILIVNAVPVVAFFVLLRFENFIIIRTLPIFGVVVCACVVMHLFGYVGVRLNKNERLDTTKLYRSDVNIDDQVERFGVMTMLRLDAVHLIFGVSDDSQTDISAMEKLSALTADSTTAETASQTDTSEATTEATTETTTQQPVVYEDNKLDIDFSEIASNDGNVQWLNEFFSKSVPTKKNKYTGMFKGYNVIFITAEGFSGYMIDKELTPTLYKLTHQGFVFNNFYTALHYTSTTNGECQNLLGLYPKNGEPQTMTAVGTHRLNVPFTLANQLNRLGYTSKGYHFNWDMYNRALSHPIVGYDWNYSNKLTLEKYPGGKVIWPQSDKYMVDQTFDLYKDDEPFNVYYMTLSGHMPYTGGGNYQTGKNYEKVENLPYSDATKCYIAANLELEYALSDLLDYLSGYGLLENTLIVMAADHVPYFDVDVMEELAGNEFGTSEALRAINERNINFDVYRNALVIWSASMTQTVNINKVCCQVDILPTVSNLLGLEYDSRMLAGSDILSDSEGLVVFSSRSWKSDKGLYNSFTGEFTSTYNFKTEEEMNSYVETMNVLAGCKIDMTSKIVNSNYYKYIVPYIDNTNEP